MLIFVVRKGFVVYSLVPTENVVANLEPRKQSKMKKTDVVIEYQGTTNKN